MLTSSCPAFLSAVPVAELRASPGRAGCAVSVQVQPARLAAATLAGSAAPSDRRGWLQPRAGGRTEPLSGGAGCLAEWGRRAGAGGRPLPAAAASDGGQRRHRQLAGVVAAGVRLRGGGGGLRWLGGISGAGA